MKDETFTKVALRYQAVFLDIHREDINMQSEITMPVTAFLARLKENGFCVSEELLHALNTVSIERLADITSCFRNVMGVDLNWASLVKGWKVPTGESAVDHLITLLANIFGQEAGFKGTTLPCGHLIPEGTFPIERYNGCPFCGKPFKTANHVYKGQGSKLKELRLFTLEDMQHVFTSLLNSATPLDGTQKDSLEQLLREMPLPTQVSITMKETAMLVIKLLVEQGKADEATKLLKTPTDILRYLWFEKTGYVQIIEPKTLVTHARKLYSHIWEPLDKSMDAADSMRKNLLLKYDRKSCLRVARWLNALPMSAQQAAENMNPKRGMWVRMIRALRLGEYSRRKGFDHLAKLLDVFYNQDYSTWQGRVDQAKKDSPSKVLSILKERPGAFSRCLFSTMLRFGSDKVLVAFEEVADKLPARLLLSLGNAAESYFDPKEMRLARPITGVTHQLEPNKLLVLYSDQECKDMANAVIRLYQDSMARRFAAQKTEAKTIYIEPTLYHIPISVGDRSATIQDASCALMGTRFPVEGDAVRLFLQWGKGLHAQPLDMDLSCRISLADGNIAECAYYNLTCVGAKHSGDIRSIPEMVGTAEYVELSLPELIAAGAKYATFTCNAYSTGALSPNLVVGWMNSAHEMKVSEEDGVAYDPSCVQHMVRISEGNLSKGLVFGVLDVAKREIIWLEMPFTSQTLRGVDSASVEALLNKLEAKLSIGKLLDMKAKSQGLVQVEKPEDADEAYTYEWALNPAQVTQLLNY
ncbi:MAG: hypothetical protein J5548_08130 [Prevotella sp.]|nr:hypothetical protein [Prevotella sp.]